MRKNESLIIKKAEKLVERLKVSIKGILQVPQIEMKEP
jgi:hypothetical protein